MEKSQETLPILHSKQHHEGYTTMQDHRTPQATMQQALVHAQTTTCCQHPATITTPVKKQVEGNAFIPWASMRVLV